MLRDLKSVNCRTSRRTTPSSYLGYVDLFRAWLALTSPQAQQEYDEAKEIFDILNEQYIRELPLLLDTRIRKYAVILARLELTPV